MEPAAAPEGLKRLSRVAGILPWLSVLALALSGLYIRLTFGRWPRVYRDSPPFGELAASIAVLAVVSWPAMVSTALLLPLVRWRFDAKPSFDRWFVSACVGAAALCLLSAQDPYGFLEWALD
jgi:hypothetical protein